MKWKTKDGQLLKPREMTEEHIKNCINLLENKIDSLESCYLDDDGDMTFSIIIASGHEIEIAEHELNKQIESFKRELKRRKKLL